MYKVIGNLAIYWPLACNYVIKSRRALYSMKKPSTSTTTGQDSRHKFTVQHYQASLQFKRWKFRWQSYLSLTIRVIREWTIISAASRCFVRFGKYNHYKLSSYCFMFKLWIKNYSWRASMLRAGPLSISTNSWTIFFRLFRSLIFRKKRKLKTDTFPWFYFSLGLKACRVFLFPLAKTLFHRPSVQVLLASDQVLASLLWWQ